MCIAVWHQSGDKQITEKILKQCWDNNDDGAGFAWYNDEREVWHVSKGYMEYEGFLEDFKKQDFQEEDHWIAHFRIGTSGLMDGGNTHPFPICDDFEEMRVMDFDAPNIVMHNGVWGKGGKVASDTMFAIADYLDPLFKYIDDEKIFHLIGTVLDYGSNRWFIARKEHIFYYGDWIKDKETGIHYSNEYYDKDRWPAYHQADHWRQAGNMGFPNTYSYPQVKPLDNFKYTHYYDLQGHFDWETWKKEYTSIWDRKAVAEKIDENTSTFLLDHKDIQSDGMVCPTCGMAVRYEQLQNGECPTCGKILDYDIRSTPDNSDEGTAFMNETTGEMIALVDAEGNIAWDDVLVPTRHPLCPSCFREEYLMDSPYNIGDTLCCKCGAIFLQATGDVIRHDPEINKEYKESA